MNVVQLFINSALKTPDQLALTDGRQKVTYKSLYDQMLDTVSEFANQGIQKKRDRVMVVVPISIETYKTVLALWYIGATAVFMEEWAFKNHFYRHKTLLDCQAVILSPLIKWLTLFRSDFKSIPIRLSSKTRRIRKQSSYDICRNPSSAIISLTSGSSGQPKIADRSHAFLAEQFNALSRIDNVENRPTVLVGLPVVVFFYLGKGCQIILRSKRLLKPNRFKALLAKFRVTHISDSPSFFR